MCDDGDGDDGDDGDDEKGELSSLAVDAITGSSALPRRFGKEEVLPLGLFPPHVVNTAESPLFDPLLNDLRRPAQRVVVVVVAAWSRLSAPLPRGEAAEGGGGGGEGGGCAVASRRLRQRLPEGTTPMPKEDNCSGWWWMGRGGGG